MKSLYLSGHGISMNIDQAKLQIKDGRKSVNEDPETYTLRPKTNEFNHLVVDGHSGHITFEAMKWITKMNIQLSILNWNGDLLTTVLPKEAIQTKLKFEQYRTYESPKRLNLAKNFINAKFKNSKVVLTWLKEKYPNVSDKIESEANNLRKCKTTQDILTVEGRVARIYWTELRKVFDDKLEFETRQSISRPKGAVDIINCLFNYGYSILESQCRKAVNTAGLDPHVGFLHEITIGKLPLCYDFQEPFRSLVDIAIITGLEKNVFQKSDFIRTENYNIRLKPIGTKKLLQELESVFNKRVDYRNGFRTWSTIIQMKAQELSYYLSGKRKELDFSNPSLQLEREDSNELREKILKIPYSKAKKLGFSKGTLFYLKENAKNDKPFKVYEPVKKKLEAIKT